MTIVEQTKSSDSRWFQIQTLDKILIYEAPGDVPHDMKYKSTYKISKNIECSSMIVTSSYIITCHDKRLHCYNFAGDEIRVWFVMRFALPQRLDSSFFRQMDSPIRYLKLIGGPPGCEAVLVGLKNGGVYQVFVNNPFPQLIAKQTGVILCLDINANRTKIAVVDETGTLYVYNLRTKELLYQVNAEEEQRRETCRFDLGTERADGGVEHVVSRHVGVFGRWISEHQSVGFSRSSTKFAGKGRCLSGRNEAIREKEKV